MGNRGHQAKKRQGPPGMDGPSDHLKKKSRSGRNSKFQVGGKRSKRNSNKGDLPNNNSEQESNHRAEDEGIQVDKETSSASDSIIYEDDPVNIPIKLLSEETSEEEHELVRQSREIDENKAKEELEGELEFQTNIKQAGENLGKFSEEDDPVVAKEQILELVRIFSRFSELRDKNISRATYTNMLMEKLSSYYGYNEFMLEKVFHIFPIPELIEFLEANELPRPLIIRTNTLLTTRRDLHTSLAARKMNIEPIDVCSNVGLQIFESGVPVGATPEYMSGYYIIQSAVSFLPVIALGALPGEFVLDMCASPGGKTTHIAACMKNTGCLIANDLNKERCKALVANIHRMGVRNTVISNCDGRHFASKMKNFDRVLLDAPCTGSGVASKDPSIKTNKNQKDLLQLNQIQKELILSAIDCTKPNGTIVYSTCSILVEENESVVNYALSKRPNVKIEETGLSVGTPGFVSFRGSRFHPGLKNSMRYYPHKNNLDGFFVAKLKKISNHIPKNEESTKTVSNFNDKHEKKKEDVKVNGSVLREQKQKKSKRKSATSNKKKTDKNKS